jgi:hypothetical protein
MIPNPHDLAFKAVFCKPEHALGVLRKVVPTAIAEALDWSALTLRPGSFVDLALKGAAHRCAVLRNVARWRRGARLLPVRALMRCTA